MKKHLSPTLSESGAALLARRQFLVLGSAAVAAAAATSLSADIVRSALVIEDAAPRLSVGFTDATLADFASTEFSPWLTAAAKLRSGDSSLRNGVLLKIHGLVRPESASGQQAKLAVDAMYRVAGHEQDVPFMAWSYTHRQRNTTASSSKPFVVPVGAKQPLSLAVSSSGVNAATGDAMLRGTVSLALGNGRRENKLRTGLYFVAVCPAGTKTPDWASIQAVASEDGKLPRLKVATLMGLQLVPFDYIVVSTDRA
ncbi:MAG TPA: hypothetical protein VEK57_23000 [Thermoanaerobaculia bacterium]|nr:hypothetical protein [Thermoanaerobaculia bacterium]